MAAHAPFPESEFAAGATMYVAFLKQAPDAKVRAAVAALRNPVDDLAVHERELYWLRRNHVGESMLSPGQLRKSEGRGRDHAERDDRQEARGEVLLGVVNVLDFLDMETRCSNSNTSTIRSVSSAS